jgi:hypothetical protein
MSRMWERNLLPPTLAGGGALGEAGDVDDLDGGGHDALGGDELVDDVEARVGDLGDADVGLGGGLGVGGGLDAGGGEGVEDGGLADEGQADDSDLEGHGDLCEKIVRHSRTYGNIKGA